MNIIGFRKPEQDEPAWMKCPSDNVEYPGLAYFCHLDQLTVTDQPDAVHAIITKDANCYTIFNSSGEKVFVAVQDKDTCQYQVKVFNNYGNEIIEVKRKVAVAIEQALIWAPSGTFVATVQRQISLFKTFAVKDGDRQTVFKVTAEGLSYVFNIIHDGEVIGVIKETARAEEDESDEKMFTVTFPKDMEVQLKAALLGTCLLLGYVKGW
ncbi:hypothetical protein JYU34_019707 [Plutella xylostella]|uniref:Phospholipid scramblase n=1 Tax=Plutella xylostella TaxID=51655 RepID=A0ABQ7PVA1_PLUXY|nr:hypothetical protein JYU34_019707 [Plutella xylostella]